LFFVDVPAEPNPDPEEDNDENKGEDLKERPAPTATLFSLFVEAADPHRDRTMEIGNNLRNSEVALALNLNLLPLPLTPGLSLPFENLLLFGQLEWFAWFAACVSIGASKADFLPFLLGSFLRDDDEEERGTNGGGRASASRTSRGEYNRVGAIVVVDVSVGVGCCSASTWRSGSFRSSSRWLGSRMDGHGPSSASSISASA